MLSKRMLWLSGIILQLPLCSSADSCRMVYEKFQLEEEAYDRVIRIEIASRERQEIIQRFIGSAEKLLAECPETVSLDRQYTLERKIKKARVAQSKLKVMSLEALRNYAITTPEKRVIYRNGRIILH